uniref:Bifunctional lysine-specific demethylase and histidyl-hydroxylase n=1 Tax=Acrobeloides nanus TaxID=290746 RepID=A0A914CY78_9BILA
MFNTNHSLQAALEAFRWLINPFDVQLFFRGIFQKRALVIKRGSPNFFSGLFNTSSFVKMLQNNYLEYGVNINIAKYTNGVRTTLNGTGRVYTGDVMKSYNEGCSIQCTNPQAFNDEIWYFCEILQELFCSFVGANTYLTPPKSSGFAPHWDDIDAFIVQTEGRKHWKVYAPKNPREALPLESSGNFTEADMVGRKIVFNDWLEQGDVLYIPRGFIHQAFTDEKSHSHHVTVSVNRKIAFVDMIEKILPDVVNLVAEQNKEMRFSLPPNAFDMAGVIDMRYDNEEAAEQRILNPLVSVAKNIQKAVTEYFEAGVDQMALEFMKTTLPPMLTPEEQALSVFGKQGIDLLNDKPVKITLNSQIRLIRKHAQRLIFETEDSYFLAHRMANSRVYEGRPEQTIPIPAESITGYISLMDAYPEWIKVKDLDCNSKKENIAFAGLLYSNGLILLKPAANEKEQLELPSSAPKNGTIKKMKKKRNTTA